MISLKDCVAKIVKTWLKVRNVTGMSVNLFLTGRQMYMSMYPTLNQQQNMRVTAKKM